MKPLRFSIRIEAPPKAVWDTMLADATYRDWTSAFMEGSHYEGSWEKGARIRFMAPDGNGMVSEIAESRPPEFLSIRHLGYVSDGVEDTDSEQVKAWAPAHENYTFVDLSGATELKIELEVTQEFEESMTAMWPKALARLKALCEAA